MIMFYFSRQLDGTGRNSLDKNFKTREPPWSYASNFRLASTRLNVVQTEFGENIGFSMRTFRFIVSGSQATEAQQQTISCDLHLEPVANVSSTQPPNCTCHTEDACNVPGK